jgi:hypothetical protein
MATEKRREDVLRKLQEQDALVKSVIEGETVLCQTCGCPLHYVQPGTGKHPGVFCDTGCTQIHIDARAKG